MKVRTVYHNNYLTRQELRHASIFMLAQLVKEPEHSKTKLSIISLAPKVRGLLGLTVPHEKNRYRFKIYLNKNVSKQDQLLALAHELVHVKQFIRRELGLTMGGKTSWKKKMIEESKYDYLDLPWELEARKKEYGLYKLWELYLQENKIKY